MPGSSDIRRPIGFAGPVGFLGVLFAVAAIVAACTTGTAGATGTPAAASPAMVASPGSVAASPADVSPSPSKEAASPTPKGGCRYGCGETPSPTTTPSPTPAAKTLTVKAGSTAIGKVLVGPNGLTLYTLTSDHTNSSGCTGTCVDDWPPLTVKSGTKVVGGPGVKGTFATFTRSDGRRQVSYRGKPLYYFAGDRSAGDTNGEGIGGVWFVAKP